MQKFSLTICESLVYPNLLYVVMSVFLFWEGMMVLTRLPFVELLEASLHAGLYPQGHECLA